jgi:RNA polymerase sigma factor (sigma-70 family)
MSCIFAETDKAGHASMVAPAYPTRSHRTEIGLDIDKALQRCAMGDERALRDIYEAEAARMIGVAQRLLKRRALAEEAVHDAFVLVWRKATSFDPARGNGLTWLYTILRNRALNILRDEKRTELRDEPVGEDTASEDDDPETIIMRLSDATELKRCLETLEPKRRNAIVLAYTQGLSHGDLSHKLGLPLGTIKSWIRRSLTSLKECLG